MNPTVTAFVLVFLSWALGLLAFMAGHSYRDIGAWAVQRWRFARSWLVREIGEGERVPWGFGLAYYLPWKPVAIALPLPFSWFYSIFRVVRYHLMFPKWRMYEFKKFRALQLQHEAERAARINADFIRRNYPGNHVR